MSDTDSIQPQDIEAQDFEQGEYETPVSDDLAEVANQLNAQITDILGDFGVSDLTEADPEYAAFMQTIHEAVPSGNGAAILRAAAKAGKAKAARLAKPVKSSHDYRKQVTEERRSKMTRPEIAPAAEQPQSGRDYMKAVARERRSKL